MLINYPNIIRKAITKAYKATASVKANPNKTLPKTFGAAEGFLKAPDM